MEKSTVSLIIDCRERAITAYEHILEEIDYEVKTISVGDYSIFKKTKSGNVKVIAQIERKSLSDFAASFKDGRSYNKSRLIEFQKQTGCKIIYLIEGDKPTNPESTYNNIPYKYIESSIFHMMLRDNFLFIWTKNQLDTAQTLVRFIKSIETLKEDIISGEEKSIGMVFPSKIEKQDDETDPQNTQNRQNRQNTQNTNEISVEELDKKLKIKKIQTNEEVVSEMWCCIRGITSSNCINFMKAGSLLELFEGKYDTTNIKTTSNRPISTLIKNRLSEIQSSDEMKAKMLAKIPKISHETAKKIIFNGLDEATLPNFCPGKVKIGKSKTEYIFNLLNFRL